MSPERVLPDGHRRTAAGVASVCAAVVLGLAAYTWHQRKTHLDGRVDALLRGTADRFGPLLERVVDTTPPMRVGLLCLLVGAVLALRGRRRAALLTVVGPGLALVAARLGQDVADRPSATVVGSHDAYPSGHMAGAAALLALVLVLTAGRGRRPWALALRAAAGAVAGTLAVALTAQRHHYVTDVVGGAALAVGVVLVVALVVDRRA